MKPHFIILLSWYLLSCHENPINKKGVNGPFINKYVLLEKKSLSRPNYTVEYPYKWTIDSADEEYIEDAFFSINAPSGGCFVTFMFGDPNLDEKEHLDGQIKEQLTNLRNAAVSSYFQKWGEYQGHGAIIKGTLLDVFQGELKIFVHSNDSSSFFILSSLFDKYKTEDEDGLKLIETSFRIPNGSQH